MFRRQVRQRRGHSSGFSVLNIPSCSRIRAYCSRSLGPMVESSACPARITSMSRLRRTSIPHSRNTGQPEHFACAMMLRVGSLEGRLLGIHSSIGSPKHFPSVHHRC